jgi:ubiquinol-cytochrome c reductase cytochrome b subunit
MSYWGAQVIISLFGAIPVVGDGMVEFIRGDYSISDITLNRFFALHVIALPLALVGLVFVHIVALHEVGSNNPDGIEIKEHKGPDGVPLDGVAFHPYHTSKDLVAILVFLMIFSAVVFFAPEMGGYFLEHANFEPANLRARSGTSRLSTRFSGPSLTSYGASYCSACRSCCRYSSPGWIGPVSSRFAIVAGFTSLH